MKYLSFVLILLIAFSIGCAGKSYVVGNPLDKAKLSQVSAGETEEGKLTSIFGEPFKKEALASGETKYTYTYFSEEPRVWSKSIVQKQTVDFYTQNGVVNRYELKSEEVNLQHGGYSK
jgi:hypothetical protein